VQKGWFNKRVYSNLRKSTTALDAVEGEGWQPVTKVEKVPSITPKTAIVRLIEWLIR